MKFYPVYLGIKKRKCVVIGGGDVAARKVENFLDCGAEVTLVARRISPALETLKKEGRIRHVPDDYQTEYIQDAFLVVGATDSQGVNERIYRDAGNMGILVNIVDDPERCDFIVPSVFRRGDLAVAISTGGKSPALARRLREDLEKRYGTDVEILLDIMGELRERVIARGESPDTNKRIFESVLDSDILSYIRERKWDKVKRTVRELSGEEIEIRLKANGMVHDG